MCYRLFSIVLALVALLGGIFAIVGGGWIFLWAALLWYGNYQVRGHQEFARNGVSQIEPARQMEELFENCRHFITYTGREATSSWDAQAFLGGRYHLTLQVPVEIESATRGRVVGEPRFYLHEVSSVTVTPSGQVCTSFNGAGQLEFGRAEWLKIVAAGGDFDAIGYHIKTGPPVPNFAVYARP